MPAREMFFTFDTKVKINKQTVLQFVEDFEDVIRLNFQDIKKEFDVNAIDTDFLKKFIKELKAFNSVSIDSDRGEVHGKQKIIKDFIYDFLGSEIREPTSILGIRYLYDRWEYEGCGYDDHYYLTYTDDVKLIKKTIKETEVLVNRLREIGVNVKFEIKE